MKGYKIMRESINKTLIQSKWNLKDNWLFINNNLRNHSKI